MFGVNVFEFNSDNDNVGGGCGHNDTTGNVRVYRSLIRRCKKTKYVYYVWMEGEERRWPKYTKN